MNKLTHTLYCAFIDAGGPHAKKACPWAWVAPLDKANLPVNKFADPDRADLTDYLVATVTNWVHAVRPNALWRKHSNVQNQS
jgi:hypothetical protein